jgi:hypothetical protein
MARKKKTGSVKVNFKDVESRRTPPEGDYPMKVLEATAGKSSTGNDQIEFVCEVSRGEYKGVKAWLYCPLADNSLWKLHAFLTALGEEVPEDEMDIDLGDLVDKEFVGVLTHETYNGRKRSKLTDFDSIDNYKDADEGKGKKKSKKDDDEDEPKGKKGKGKKEPEMVLKSAVDEMDRDELEELIEEHDLEDVDPSSKKLKKDDDALREAVLEALEEKELLEDDTKKSKKNDKGGKKKAKKYDKDEVEDMDEDELQELIDESGIDVDLDDYKKLPKKVAAVIEALEEAELLDE